MRSITNSVVVYSDAYTTSLQVNITLSKAIDDPLTSNVEHLITAASEQVKRLASALDHGVAVAAE